MIFSFIYFNLPLNCIHLALLNVYILLYTNSKFMCCSLFNTGFYEKPHVLASPVTRTG